MSAVDRMDVLRQATWPCEHGTGLTSPDFHGYGECGQCGAKPVVVEYVPADQLRGAVEEIDEAIRLLEAIPGQRSHPNLLDARVVLRSLANRLGGQS